MLKKRLVILLVLSTILFSTNSFAWGDREQAAVWGGIGGLLLGSMINNNSNQNQYNRNYYEQPQPYVERRYYYQPQPQYYEPPRRVYIEERPYYREYHYYGR